MSKSYVHTALKIVITDTGLYFPRSAAKRGNDIHAGPILWYALPWNAMYAAHIILKVEEIFFEETQRAKCPYSKRCPSFLWSDVRGVSA